jgi:hypothetical protein
VTTDLNLSARSAPLALMLRFTTRFDVSYDTLPERSVLLAVPSLQPQTRCLSRDPARLFHACALPNLASLGLSHFAFQTFTGVHASRLRAPHFFLLPPATLTHQLPTRFRPSTLARFQLPLASLCRALMLWTSTRSRCFAACQHCLHRRASALQSSRFHAPPSVPSCSRFLAAARPPNTHARCSIDRTSRLPQRCQPCGRRHLDKGAASNELQGFE